MTPSRPQADHRGERIPRPEQTPDALRAALAIVALGRLEEMQAKNKLEHEDPAIVQGALRELSAVLDAAMKAVRE
ncbi:hypothetical protein ACFYWX_07760 [Streptomyces sp. NPDC002888]|uniref:hypothetical protein n=1 Tax=Streptomyces sp. NPDC002888 TaxID=3364668 RepID=UPI00368C09A3